MNRMSITQQLANTLDPFGQIYIRLDLGKQCERNQAVFIYFLLFLIFFFAFCMAAPCKSHPA